MFNTATRRAAIVASVIGVVAFSATALAGGASASAARAPGSTFGPNSAEITNPFLPITKFNRCVLAGNDQGQHLRIVRTLEKRKKTFQYQGQTVKTSIVKDRVFDTDAGQMIEKTVDYFAQDHAGTVYYFGEDVNEYENGQLINHDGQWRVGRDTDRAGVLMPANPRVGDSFFSEKIPGVAVEKDTIVGRGKTQRFGGHTYHHVLRIREDATTPKPAEVEFKTYAPGTGVITEANGGVHLIGCT